MNKKAFVLSVLVPCLISPIPSHAEEQAAAPLYQVTAVQNPAKAINYRNLKGGVEIDFKGTVLQPDAKGSAKIENDAGVTQIEAKFEKLAAATQFGPEFLTYVFWAISPDGRASNLGELTVSKGNSKIATKTPLQTVTLLVTAEPYFAVTQPSSVVVLENAIKANNKEKIEYVDAKYDLLARGQYTVNVAAKENQPQMMDKKTPPYVYQARNAIRIAKDAGAETYATDGFKNAERLLAVSESKEGGKKKQTMAAREAIQSAEDSRSVAMKRKREEELTSVKGQAAMAEMEKQDALALASSATADAEAAKAKVRQVEAEKVALRAQLLAQLNAVLQTTDSARGLIVNMPDALFQIGSAKLRSNVREKMAKIAGIVSSHPGLKLAIEGHTDSVGTEEANQKLSEQRAESTKDYLVSQGVAAKSITTKGFGETKPVASNDTPEGQSKNRRVEVIVSGEAIGQMAFAQ